MKKFFACILMAALMIATVAFAEEADPFKTLKTALDVDLILTNRKSVAVNRIYYDYDGNEMFSVFLYAGFDENGQQMIVSEDSEGSVEILSETACVGFDTWSMKIYVMGFVADEYEENTLQMKQNFFADVRLNEKFFSEEMKQDERIITTKTYYQGEFEGECDAVEYILDAESGEIREIFEYYENEAGERILNSRAFVTMDAEYEINPAFAELMHSQNTRKIYVHMPEGDILEFTAPVDVEMLMIYPEENVLYEDEEKVRMYAGQEADDNGLFPAETHLYLDVFF